MAPLLDEISAGVGLTPFTAGLLHDGAGAVLRRARTDGPGLAQRFGIECTLVGVLAGRGRGSAFRLIPTVGALFVGTLLIGAGIAIGNILLPGLIKRGLPALHRVDVRPVHARHSPAERRSAPASRCRIARAAGLDWNFALGAWGLFAVLGLIVWLPGLRGVRARHGAGAADHLELGRDPVAWLVTRVLRVPVAELLRDQRLAADAAHLRRRRPGVRRADAVADESVSTSPRWSAR